MKANTDTLQKQEEEKSFQYRSYGKGELAMLYIPNVQQQSAVDRFNEWIEAVPGLKERLLSTGMNPRSRHYTPAQVRLIVEVLQEPWKQATSIAANQQLKQNKNSSGQDTRLTYKAVRKVDKYYQSIIQYTEKNLFFD